MDSESAGIRIDSENCAFLFSHKVTGNYKLFSDLDKQENKEVLE